MSSSESENVGSSIMDLIDLDLTDEMTFALLEKEVVPYVNFSGLKRVHRQVLEKEINAIMECSNMKELFKSVERARYRWIYIGVFDDIKLSFEPIKDASPKEICVHFHVEERKPTRQIGAFTSDASIPEVSASLNNLWNSRYTLTGKYIPPAARAHAFSMSLTSNVPFFGRTSEYHCGIRMEERLKNLAAAEKVEEVKMVTTDVEENTTKQITFGLQRRHTACRDMHELPERFRSQLGQNMKAYASHNYHYTTEEFHPHPALYSMYPLPIGGFSLYAGNEIGMDPNSRNPVWKSDFQWSRHLLLHPLLVLTLGVKVGLAASATGQIPINDRLFLGWRHVRGYTSIGPSTAQKGSEGEPIVAKYSATGGNALWASTASLNFPMPLIPSNGLLTMHMFANVGNCDYFTSIPDLRQRIDSLFRDACFSFGGGIVITQMPFFGVLPSGRFEFNVSYPMYFGKDTSTFIERQRGLFDRFRFGLIWSSASSE
eukprot:Tbor_TRINITY_DN3608_c0_g1::TRINITY_DN3608_c0_g1_i1::g.220::m.220/K07277/SAM50, TOB55, bamA; outer membrane protein insertion porin family